jgi:hypothetical protein
MQIILAKHMLNKRFAPRVQNIQHKVSMSGSHCSRVIGIGFAAVNSIAELRGAHRLQAALLHIRCSLWSDVVHVTNCHMHTMQMEIMHYNNSAVEVGEVICKRAKDLQAAAVVMARCAAALSLLQSAGR